MFVHQTRDLECFAYSSNTLWNPPTIFRPGPTETTMQNFLPLSCELVSQQSRLFLNGEVSTNNDSKMSLHKPANSGAVREGQRGETIVDSSEDETWVRRVSAVLEGPPGRIQRDSDVEVSLAVGNEIASRSPPSEVQGPDEDSESETDSVPGIDRRTRRRLSLVWRANIGDAVPVQNMADLPDSDQRLRRVRRAMQTERQEARIRAEFPVRGPPPPSPPCMRRGWEAMDTIDLQAEFRCRVRCLQGVPSFLRGQFRSALVTSLEAMRTVYQVGDFVSKCRSWKVFRLTSRMLLWRHQQRGPSKAELERRMELFNQQDWVLLLEEARNSATRLRRQRAQMSEEEDLVRRARQAEKFVHQGEVSRARQVLCSQAKAPGTSATLNELRDPERRPSRLSEAIPIEISRFWPQHQFQLDREKYACNLRAAPRGSAGGVAGDTNEQLKVLLEDEEATLLVTEAAEHLSVADVPGEIAEALGLAALTALLKEDGRIRGIVTDDTFRRGVARTLAQQCAKKFEEACMPFQYALSTRAGTD